MSKSERTFSPSEIARLRLSAASDGLQANDEISSTSQILTQQLIEEIVLAQLDPEYVEVARARADSLFKTMRDREDRYGASEELWVDLDPSKVNTWRKQFNVLLEAPFLTDPRSPKLEITNDVVWDQLWARTLKVCYGPIGPTLSTILQLSGGNTPMQGFNIELRPNGTAKTFVDEVYTDDPSSLARLDLIADLKPEEWERFVTVSRDIAYEFVGYQAPSNSPLETSKISVAPRPHLRHPRRLLESSNLLD